MKICLENVSTGYSKNSPVLSDISTEFEEGGICGILGPNGSGKTTLLRTLSGTLPYSGSIVLSSEKNNTSADTDNVDNSWKKELKTISSKVLARYIAVTPQISSIYFSYSVYDTVMMGRYAHSSSFLDNIRTANSRDKEIVNHAIEMTGLKDISKKQLLQLSGGQLQRVMLARTFAQETPVILLDEPTNHLDIQFHFELMEHLKNWSQGRTIIDGFAHKNTVISVFHDIGDSAMICDTILLMKNGKTIKKGPVQEILTQNLLNDIFETDVIAYYSDISKALN